MDRIEDALARQPAVAGAGPAGLVTALHLSPQPAIVRAKAPLGSTVASAWSQIGIAAAPGADSVATAPSSTVAVAVATTSAAVGE